MTTMVIGWLWGKRYSRVQVFSVIVLTAGIVVAAMADSSGAVRNTRSRFLFYFT